MKILKKKFRLLRILKRRILVYLFRLNNWHSSLCEDRPYAQMVILLANSTHANSLIDFGCGLGEISLKAKAENKLLVDSDPKIIRYLSFIKLFTNQNFRVSLTADMAKYELAIVVNWTHNIDPDSLRVFIKKLHAETISDGGYLIVDKVKSPIHKYSHDFNKLMAGLFCILTMAGPFEYGREIILARKI